MLELEDAQQRLAEAIQPLAAEFVSLDDALGKFLAADVIAPIDLPPFDNSAMDGYAVRSADVTGASEACPKTLHLLGKVAAGREFSGRVQEGTCVRVFTGSPLPSGADAVVMQEDTHLDSSDPGIVRFLEAATPWQYVRFRGEDVKQGKTILQAGERINAARVNLLAGLGIRELRVSAQPVVALLATGTELVEPGQPLAPAKIYESNRLSLAALIRKCGAISHIFPLVPDSLSQTEEALKRAFEDADVVVTTGGVSVGEFDFVKSAFERLGGELTFWKVAIKPGKPFVFGKLGKKLFCGLPGNPVSAMVTFWLLVRGALLQLQGASEIGLQAAPGVLAEPLSNPGDRRHYVRVSMDASGSVRSSGIQASHVLSALASCNGLVAVPPKTTLDAGSTVPVLLWD